MNRVFLALCSLALPGCFDFSTDLGELALDYRIDRARVVAIRLDPPIIMPGEPVTAHALALAPGALAPDSVEVAVCGLRDDLQVSIWTDPVCFQNPDLVDVVATELPGSWSARDLSQTECLEEWDTGKFVEGGDSADTDDTGDTGFVIYSGECVSIVPMMVTASFGDQVGRGMIRARHRLRGLRVNEPVPVPLDSAARALTTEGDAVAGGEVQLTFRIESGSAIRQYWWYVDDGTLMSTGLTRTQAIEVSEPGEEEPEEPVLEASITRNTLRIPADYSGPLRVVVVATPDRDWDVDDNSAYASGNVTWETLTLQVTP
ncbi:MAG: hypothetical protein AB8H79_12970 [Myxococcota bacterium]